MGKDGGCGFPLKPLAVFRKSVCPAWPLYRQRWSQGHTGGQSGRKKTSCLTLGGNFSHGQNFPVQTQRVSLLILNLFRFPVRTETLTVIKNESTQCLENATFLHVIHK